MSAIDPALLALAGVGLPDAWPLPAERWGERLDDVFSHGLAGLLSLAAREGLIELDEAAVVRLGGRLESEAIRAVQLEGELIRLEPVLIEFSAVVLKGAVLAHGAYPSPALRPFTDLDLLIEGPRHKSAVRALESMGYTRSRPEPAPRYEATVGKAHTLVHPGGIVIDLHRTLVAGLAGASIDVSAILAERRPVPIGGQLVAAPSWEAHFVEVCLHAVIGDGLGRALSIRDVAQVALLPQLDAERAAELARRWKVGGVVTEALRAAVNAFGIELPPALVPPSGALPAPQPAPAQSARGRLAELGHGDLRQRFTLLRSLVAPSRDFLKFSYGDQSTPRLYGRRWRSLIRRAGDAGSPRPAPRPTAKSGGLTTQRQLAPSEIDRPTAPERDPLDVDPSDRPSTVFRKRLAHTSPTFRASPLVAPAVITLPSRTDRRPLSLGRAASADPPPRSGVPGAGNGTSSRQDHWAAGRPPRLQAEPGDPTPPPPPPPAPPPPGAEPLPPASPVAANTVPAPGGMALLIGAIAVLGVTAIGARVGVDAAGVVLVPIAAMLLAWSASRHISRRRPEEAWVGRWLVLGTVVKIAASYARYLTLIIGYEGVGDSTDYDHFGRLLAQGWMGNGIVPQLKDLRETNFLRWFTGVVYFCFGANEIAGFFVFGLLALVGSYLWYRATADAVPFIDKRLYLGLVLFAPSIAFWPSSIGKESLMQLGIGAMAFGTASLLRQRLVPGLAVGGAGGWLLWVVRPHLLALVMVGAAFAYLVGRVRPAKSEHGSLVIRSLGLLVIGIVCAFAIGQAAQFLGIKDLSVSSVETALDKQSTLNTTSSSSFDNGGDYLSPVNLPRGIVTVLVRPFPWETSSPFQLLASLESVLVAGLIVVRFSSIRTSLARARGTPFLLYCWVLTILYSATFASFSNFGLLVRQRSLVLPALFVLVAVRPDRDTERPRARGGSEDPPVVQGAGR